MFLFTLVSPCDQSYTKTMITPQKHLKLCFLISLGLFSICANAQTVDASSVVGKVICGYQAWFNCFGDGSPVMSWRHWCPGVYQSNEAKPKPGNVTFEIYPDITDYSPGQLFQTGLAPLGDGRPAKLFSSYQSATINQHFGWMQQHGIDGVALQRFTAGFADVVVKQNRDSINIRVKEAAETYGRIFYIMYDFSGVTVSQFEDLKVDWRDNLVGVQHLTSSSAYAHQDGKPVVCLWGLGFTHVSGSATQCADLINWFKSQGCYVIGGTPTHWRKGINDAKPDFVSVYMAYDMISPWSVGRYALPVEVDVFMDSLLIPDLDWCQTNGVDYQPVIFPGFAWSNWNGNLPNVIPRLAGTFFWHQAYNIRSLNIPSVYVAMFDEYDEGTAIAPAADSYLSVPTDQYFLTYSADGKYVSPDFYMRLTGEVTSLIKKTIPISSTFKTKLSEGPVYFRTSVETGFDATTDWSSSPDPSSIITNVSGTAPGGKPFCASSTTNPKTGLRSIKFEGTDESTETSFAYMKVFDVNIPVASDTWLSFNTFPVNALSLHGTIDLIMTDGSTLRDSGAEDTNGIPMHPGALHGHLNEWTKTTCNIGAWLQGKTIDRILIAYDNGAETGDFTTYFDDIIVYKKDVISGTGESTTSRIANPIKIYPNPITTDKVTIEFSPIDPVAEAFLRIYTLDGQLKAQQWIPTGKPMAISFLDWPCGIYIFSVLVDDHVFSERVVYCR